MRRNPKDTTGSPSTVVQQTPDERRRARNLGWAQRVWLLMGSAAALALASGHPLRASMATHGDPPLPKDRSHIEAAAENGTAERPLPEHQAPQQASTPQDGATEYRVAWFRTAIRPQDRAALQSMGLRILDYVPDHGLLVSGPPSALASLDEAARRDLSSAANQSPLPLRVQRFPLGWKLSRQFPQEGLGAGAGVSLRTHVVAHPGVRWSELATMLTEIGAGEIHRLAASDRPIAVATLSKEQRQALARRAGVQWLEPAAEITPRNDALAATLQSGGPTSTPLWARGLLGEGEVAGVIDDELATDHCAFADVLPIGATHRKVLRYRPSLRPGTSRQHGTHVAATLLGDPSTISGTPKGRGVAFDAQIAFASYWSLGATAPTDFFALALANHAVGARVHNNSWGDDGTSAYNVLARSVDDFSWANPDDLVVFACTNGFVLANPENAKNCLSVTASGNGLLADTVCSGPLGTTTDGRRKPDLIAPGCGILSADASLPCGSTSDSGTSMATAGVSGAALLTREYFRKGYYPTGAATAANGFEPSGALIKAVLINSTRDHLAQAGNPTSAEGFGRPVLDDTLYFAGDPQQLRIVDVSREDGLSQPGEARTLRVEQASAGPLTITLAFMDRPGALFAADPVVHDLDLRVTAPDGTVHLGNALVGGQSTAGGTADRRNNVEQVSLPMAGAGIWLVEVSAYNVPLGAQGYGLVMRGNFAPCSTLATASPYGSGSPQGPTLSTGQRPVLGSDLRVVIRQAPSSRVGFLAWGFQRTQTNSFGFTNLVVPTALRLVFSDITGSALTTFPIPTTSQLCGLSVHAQFAIPGTTPTSPWLSSQGLSLRLGH